MKPDINIKVQEIDIPERLRRRCDDHIQKLEQIKDKIGQGRDPVFNDLYNLSDEVTETARLSL